MVNYDYSQGTRTAFSPEMYQKLFGTAPLITTGKPEVEIAPDGTEVVSEDHALNEFESMLEGFKTKETQEQKRPHHLPQRKKR